MSERKSSIFVGAFVVGALIIAAAGALFFAGGGLGSEKSKVVMVFDGSLRGLTIGAPVALRGVTIGQVTDIDLILDADHGEVTMIVEADISGDSMQLVGSVTETILEELVERGLSAQLNTQSLLTGLLYIQLDFQPDKEASFSTIASPHPQIPTIPTELEQLRRSLETIDYAAIAENVDRIASGLDELLNSSDMQSLPGSMRSTLEALEAASTSLTTTLEENSSGLKAFLDEGTRTVATLNAELPDITDAIEGSLQRLDEALVSANASLGGLERAAAPDSPPRRQLSQAMQEVTLAARALRSLARSLEEHPESLLRGRPGDES
ncbi:MlaD family protein [Congregibacter litoralis]|uniref:Mce related protein n=1 Tax=Congregibacter litoralis KT71 TaxID=314285 RepID=A4ACJ8_9GAMM|nr:MlaD family protein [Congregibacter litoralis]EAQ96212.1 mce related protein [Congregibacter litoralis KT71]